MQMNSQGSTKPEREGKGKELNRGAMVREIYNIAGFQNEGRDLLCMAETEAQDFSCRAPQNEQRPSVFQFWGSHFLTYKRINGCCFLSPRLCSPVNKALVENSGRILVLNTRK